MSPRISAVLALVVAAAALSACGGDDTGNDSLASAEALADELSSLASQAPADADADAEPATDDPATADAATDPAADAGDAASTMSDEAIGDLVCTSLSEIAADIAAGNVDPVFIQANFTIGTLGATDEAIANAGAITERADAVAANQCPDDLATVLGAVQMDSLSTLYSEPIQ